MNFHAKDGLFFERTVDGGVHIYKTKKPKDNSPKVDVYLDHDMWCDVIASMSWQSKTLKTWQEAKRFHGHAPGMPAAPLKSPRREMNLQDRKTSGFAQCVGCGHPFKDHTRRVYPQYKETQKRIAVIDARKKPKVYYECDFDDCGCENFLVSHSRKSSKADPAKGEKGETKP